MKIIDQKIYTGRNIYSHRVCMKLTVDVGDLCDTPTKDIKGFNTRLLNALPGLKSHSCCRGYAGGFLERLDEGTYLPHVLEHSIIEMQLSLGFKKIKYGKARQQSGSIYNVIFEYELEKAGILCAEYALKCFNEFINDSDFDMDTAIKKIEEKISKYRLGASTKSIYNEARKRGIPVNRIGSGSILQLGYGKSQKRISATITDNTSCIGVDISCDKALTRDILSDLSIPIPRGGLAESESELIDLCNEIGYPIVIKPIDGSKGRGITVNINSDEEAIIAYRKASEVNTKVVVEGYVKGRDYRLLVIDKKVVAASLKLPPHVVGNGEDTVEDLIYMENENPLRGYGHEKPLTKIEIDDGIINHLKASNRDLNTVPKRDEVVYLRNNANLSTGGTSKDCTEKVHNETIDIAIRAVEAIGLDVAGVDICTEDISKPLRESGGAILEINAAPGIRMHIHPCSGKERNVASHILDYMYKDEEKAIPIVSITGTNGKTTTTRMVAHALSLNGHFTGMTTTSGIYLDGRCIEKGDTTGPDSAKVILMDKRVEAAVLETARGGMLRRGLGYDLSDVGVVTNITEDHLGIDGINTLEDLAYVKSLVLEAVRDDGYAVINADDPHVNMLTERVPDSVNIVYFSSNADNLIIKKHILDGKSAVFLRDNYICISKDESIEPIVDITEVPCTMEGKLLHNIENSLCAVATLTSLKLEKGVIEKSLKTFLSDETTNPGRFNIYKIEGFNVIVDYGHNIDAYIKVINSVKAFNSNRYIGVIGVPGDRDDESMVSIGEIAGNGFDYVYIKEDGDRRGRKVGETASLLEAGVSKHKSRDDYSVIIKEDEALISAMESANEGDTIVVFYEDLDLVVNTIKSYKLGSTKSEGAIS
ncbi:cyanophycin synthetase [Clostridium cylindrosporum]|uniref:Cyanophycin synthetase n=1 Tax=Clostridium cylindrosporum DSM 605 TaxID=1121307 RepID=A0A0J8DAE4_CLOCY|nr:cyanophycin synthetase [Clostridium cylindrosporum]KMT22822.1 cyanophycin synthetase [Clostridium cylindrosporum DSM 605]